MSKERAKLTREQAIAFCEEKIKVFEKARDHIKASCDLRKDRVAKIKHNSHIEQINAYTDIIDLLRQ